MVPAQFLLLNNYPELVHGVSTAEFGNMSYLWGEAAIVRQNRQKFFAALNVHEKNAVVASIVHGHAITDVTEIDRGKGILDPEESIESDILVTDKPDTFLFVIVADCLALLFYEPVKQVCALAHAGWKGVDQEVPRLTVEHMVKKYGCDPKEIRVGFPPALQASSSLFTHPENIKVLDETKWQPYIVKRPEGTYQADWVGFAVNQLFEAGITKEHIENPGIDTRTSPDYFSHRRSVEDEEPEARFGCLIGFRGN